ncbi:MAG: hypothetical protein JJE25_12765 [Bacteroidia bacterium]|nr:hypothetical protein [Bacteroidia bacterium]
MKKIFILLFFFSVFFTTGFSQQPVPDFSSRIDSLKKTGQLILKGKTDSVRSQANSIFIVLLMETLALNGAYDISFDSITNVSILSPPDKSFRLFTWVLPGVDLSSYSYFGFVQQYNRIKKQLKVIPLEEMQADSENIASKKLTSEKWFGSIYYQILPVKKNGKNYYTLLGWKGNNELTTKKMIDVMYFTEGKPMFGYPIFKGERGYTNRIIFEFNAEAMMSLRYEASKKMIVFDRLVSSAKESSANSNGPSGIYDGFKFEKGRWLLMKDIDVRGTWKPKTPVERDEDKENK